MHFNVYGVGNALVDIHAPVNDSQLASLGYAKGIMTLVEAEDQRRVLEAIEHAPVKRSAGGSAANTIMGIADFGGQAAFAGKVAVDELGMFCLADMRKLGVAASVPPGDGQTGTCVALVTDDAQRTMLTNLAISSELSPDDLSEDEIRASDYIYIEGYLFTGDSTRAAALHAIELAQAHQVKVALTVSDPFLIGLFRDEFWRLIEGPVDLLFCNLEEARALTEEQDAIDCAHAIHQHAENVALTLGAQGSILMHDGEAIPIEGVDVEAVDTTGAGDMYAAGILYGITNGLTWKQAGHLASHAAARIVAQYGARLAEPFTPEEVQQLLD